MISIHNWLLKVYLQLQIFSQPLNWCICFQLIHIWDRYKSHSAVWLSILSNSSSFIRSYCLPLLVVLINCSGTLPIWKNKNAITNQMVWQIGKIWAMHAWNGDASESMFVAITLHANQCVLNKCIDYIFALILQFVWIITVSVLGQFRYGWIRNVWIGRHQIIHSILGPLDVWFIQCDQRNRLIESAYCHDVQFVCNDWCKPVQFLSLSCEFSVSWFLLDRMTIC